MVNDPDSKTDHACSFAEGWDTSYLISHEIKYISPEILAPYLIES